MENIERKLIFFFEQVAQKNEDLLKTLEKKKCFCIEHEGWQFTLPDLYFFLKKEDDVFLYISYKQFRKLIFNSNINRSIKLYGAKIIIKENKAKVDNSKYFLNWSNEK